MGANSFARRGQPAVAVRMNSDPQEASGPRRGHASNRQTARLAKITLRTAAGYVTPAILLTRAGRSDRARIALARAIRPTCASMPQPVLRRTRLQKTPPTATKPKPCGTPVSFGLVTCQVNAPWLRLSTLHRRSKLVAFDLDCKKNPVVSSSGCPRRLPTFRVVHFAEYSR